jgi:hypothetical protein
MVMSRVLSSTHSTASMISCRWRPPDGRTASSSRNCWIAAVAAYLFQSLAVARLKRQQLLAQLIDLTIPLAIPVGVQIMKALEQQLSYGERDRLRLGAS